MRYSNWSSNEPDNGGNTTSVKEACLAMEQGRYLWNDADCSDRICAVCEYHDEDDKIDHSHDHHHHHHRVHH